VSNANGRARWGGLAVGAVLVLALSACNKQERAVVDRIADELIAEEGTVFPPTPEPPPTPVPTPVPEPTKKVSINVPDPSNDTRVCSNGLPAGGEANPSADFTGFSFENDPDAEVTTFSMNVAAPEISGDVAGGIEFYYPGVPLAPFDERWFFNNVGQNSINFVLSGDELIMSRAFVNDEGWTFADSTEASGSLSGGQFEISIPHNEFMPDDLGLDASEFFFFVTITDYSQCDDVGLNPASDPAAIRDFDFDLPAELFADGFESGDVSAWSYSRN
jgi:hypothetical protein